MAVSVYLSGPVSVKQLAAAIIPPKPGELVATLLERGLVGDAIAVQRHQYAEGARRAWYDLPADDNLPAAVSAGYSATMADMTVASLAEEGWL